MKPAEITEPGLQPFVLSFEAYQEKSDHKGPLGGLIEIEKPIEVTHLGIWKLEDSAASAQLLLVDAKTGKLLPGTEVELDLSDAAANAFHYAKLPEPVRMEPGQRYYLLSRKGVSPGRWYHEYTMLRTTSAAKSLGTVWRRGMGEWVVQYFEDSGYGPLNFLYRSSDPSAAAIRKDAWHQVDTVPFSPRLDFGRRLELEGTVLHGAGQSSEAFANYASLLPEHPPAIYMEYTSIGGYKPGWLTRISEAYAAYPFAPVMQLGLSMTVDGQPEKRYEEAVAAGIHDEKIAAIIRDLKTVDRPVFIRLGYEFNGGWNGYRPEPFKQAWRRVVAAFREAGLDKVAFVWCASGDGIFENFMDFYPGDEWVDWWAIDLFSAHHFYHPGVHAFMAQALERRFPVMIGESTPRYIGSGHGDASWRLWYQPYFNFIREHPQVKAFCYIDWDWSNTSWPWGDGRIELSPVVLEHYRQEVANPVYRHGPAY